MKDSSVLRGKENYNHPKCDRAENMTVTGNQLYGLENISQFSWPCGGAKGTHFPRQKMKKMVPIEKIYQ